MILPRRGTTGLVPDQLESNGWFLGGGTEYQITTSIPGLFWKNEFRFSEFDNRTAANVYLAAANCGAAYDPLTR